MLLVSLSAVRCGVSRKFSIDSDSGVSAVLASSAVHPFLLDASFGSGALSSALSEELSSKFPAPSKLDGIPRVLWARN